MRVLIVEDHPTTRVGIRTVLELGDHEVVGEAGSAKEALRFVEELGPDLVVLDLRLRGEDGGVRLCRDIKALPDAPLVLAYTAYNSVEELAACRAAGADGYVHKSEEPDELLDAAERLRAGRGAWLLGAEIEEPDLKLREALKCADLTAREREVFELLRKRRTDPEIAEQLSISPLTVKTHVANILGKLGFGSRREIS